MTETFTTIINSTSNPVEMREQDSNENFGTDEIGFYDSIRVDLDLIVSNPRVDTVEKILNHSKNLR